MHTKAHTNQTNYNKTQLIGCAGQIRILEFSYKNLIYLSSVFIEARHVESRHRSNSTLSHNWLSFFGVFKHYVLNLAQQQLTVHNWLSFFGVLFQTLRSKPRATAHRRGAKRTTAASDDKRCLGADRLMWLKSLHAWRVAANCFELPSYCTLLFVAAGTQFWFQLVMNDPFNIIFHYKPSRGKNSSCSYRCQGRTLPRRRPVVASRWYARRIRLGSRRRWWEWDRHEMPSAWTHVWRKWNSRNKRARSNWIELCSYWLDIVCYTHAVYDCTGVLINM